MNPYLLLGIALAWAVSMAGAAWSGKEWAEGQHAKAEQERAKMLEELRADNAIFADHIADQTVKAIAGIRITNRTITNEVRHEREVHRVLDNPDCRLPASTTGLLNRARAGGVDSGGASAGGTAAGVPTPATPPAQPAAPAGRSR